MSINSKSDEAHRLARQLAALAGESLTTAVTVAIRERVEREQRSRKRGLAERLLAIGRDSAPRFKEPYRSGDHGDLLYDERGLPR